MLADSHWQNYFLDDERNWNFIEMADNRFFENQKDQSLVKATIVQKYFFAWATVIKNTVLSRPKGRLAYIDLFAGPGRYKDGAASVPLMILEKALQDDFLREHLVTIFNDKDDENSQTLENEIGKLQNIKALKYSPNIMNQEVGDNIVKAFEEKKLVPTLFFVDPWGYKGLSLRLVNSVLKNWGSDCIFFFNYNRINPGLSNPAVKEHMDALFGKEGAERVRSQIAQMTPAQREIAIVEALTKSLNDMGGNFVLPFNFKNEQGNRTTHYLIFVSKHVRGYEIMKGIMAKESSGQQEGIASFSYCEADESSPLLFEFARPLSQLGEHLLVRFQGRTMKMVDVYDQHHIGRPFIKKNYKDALVRLERNGKISITPNADERPNRKGLPTCADHVSITFPRII